MLDAHIPVGYFDSEEMDLRSNVWPQWQSLAQLAEDTADKLAEVQGPFKRMLGKDVKQFVQEVARFREEFEAHGPLHQGISPQVAISRLKTFAEKFTRLEARMIALGEGEASQPLPFLQVDWWCRKAVCVVSLGEALFGLKGTAYPELVQTKKELQLCDTLYSLYTDVNATFAQFKDASWRSVLEMLTVIGDKVGALDSRCKRLPKQLKTWDAYAEIRTAVTEFQEVAIAAFLSCSAWFYVWRVVL
jgi:dynein heavy chain, axonemal